MRSNSMVTRRNISTSKYRKIKKFTMVLTLSLMAAVLMSCFTLTAFATTAPSASGGGSSTIVNTTAFINTAEKVLSAIIILSGAALCVFGLVGIAESNADDNPASKTKGIKQLMGGIAIIIIAITLIPVLGDMMRNAAI